MENRFCSIFLGLVMILVGNASLAQDTLPGDESSPLIRPQVERRVFDEASIDSDDFELSVHVGFLSIEDFGVNAIQSVGLAYHITPELFTRINLGRSEGDRTSFEVLSGGAPLLTSSERRLEYYRVDLGYNLLPGEAFVGSQKAYNTAFYISAGIGSTEFAGDDRFTFNYAAGYRFLMSDSSGLYTEFRNNVFDMDLFGENKVTNNLEFTLGISLIF